MERRPHRFVSLPVFAAAAAAVLAAAAVSAPGAATPAAPERDGPASRALARLAALAGDWEGSSEWTGARTGGGPMNAQYYTTGRGSAVVENLVADGAPVMTTVYHTDGADLRMTHFCGAKNQPRLKASRIDLAAGALDFAYVDATNLAAPDAPHVTALELRFGDDEHLTLTFTFEGGGKTSRERIALRRAVKKARSTGDLPVGRRDAGRCFA